MHLGFMIERELRGKRLHSQVERLPLIGSGTVSKGAIVETTGGIQFSVDENIEVDGSAIGSVTALVARPVRECTIGIDHIVSRDTARNNSRHKRVKYFGWI